MSISEHAPENGDFLARLGLRAAAEGIPDDHPDAFLLRTLRAATESKKTRAAAFDNWNARPSKRTGTKAEAAAAFHRAADDYAQLEDLLIRTRARTPDGAIAKLQFILGDEEFDSGEQEERCGSTMSLPLSAMRDALAMMR